MKHGLPFVLMAASLSFGCGGAGVRQVMRVDRTFDRLAPGVRSPATPDEEISSESYRSAPPADRWEVKIDGSKVSLRGLGVHAAEWTRIEGKEVAGIAGQRRFDLDTMAGGRFVLRGDDAEITVYGSGVPVILSERGKLVVR